MSLEINIPFYGTEITLRPVSAKGYLKSLENAEKASAGKENADYIKKTYFWANMIAQSAFLGEEKLFSSGEEALEKMTMEDIAKIGGEIFEEIGLPELPEINENTEEKTEKGKKLFIPEEFSGREPVSADSKAENADAAKSNKRETETETSRSSNNTSAQSVMQETLTGKKYSRFFGVNTPLENNAADYRKYYYYREQELKRVSDFFEKDSRRFDGTFR